MTECKNCRKSINTGYTISCKSCGATFCGDCAKQTKMICPYCYSNLEYTD